MGCSAKGGKESDESGMGILTGHAYSILDTAIYNEEKLIKVRNPWGQKEWTGRWSDHCKLTWNEKSKKALHFKDANDGTFWMSFEDWKKYYSTLNVCRLYNDSEGHIYSRYIMKGYWDGVEAGGCFNFPQTWKNNPQYGIILKKASNVAISLVQEDPRIITIKHKIYAIGFAVFKSKDATKRKAACYANELVDRAPKTYAPFREAMLEVNLEPGHYVIVPTTFNPGEQARFHLTVLSYEPLHMHYINLTGGIEETTEMALLETDLQKTNSNFIDGKS